MWACHAVPVDARLHRLIIAAVLGLSACGGSSSPTAISGNPSTPALTGSVDFGTLGSELPAGAIVCVDRNADQSCGAGEEQAAVGNDGAYALSLPADADPATLTLLASWPDPATAHPTVMVAPASAGVISALTTIAWASRPAGEAADARATWLQSLGLAATLDIYSASDPAARQLNAELVPALARTEQAVARGTSAANVIRPAVSALLGVLPKYVDSARGSLIPTVRGRTLAAEAAYWAVGSLECTAPRIVATMQVSTEGAAPIVSRDDYLRAVVTITTTAGAVEQLPARIRGRGNSTWSMPKKPYRIKLDVKAPMLGMTANRDWTLLANYADKTLMRNALAFCIGRMLGFTYTPDSRFVELTVNGDYVGIFQVSDQIEVAGSRVDIDVAVRNGSDADLGFLIELDQYLDPGDEIWFRTPSGIPYAIKSDIEKAQAPLVANYMAQLEAALFGDGFLDPATGYARYLDADTLVDFYLVNELLRNNDAFLSSTYMYRPRGRSLAFGPLWDFDRSTGNATGSNESPEGWAVRQVSTYVARLIEHDPDFRQHLAARWSYLHGRLRDIQDFLTAGAAGLDAAQVRNFRRWPILGTIVWPNPAAYGSYAAEVDHLRTWLSRRASWMDGQIRKR